MEPNGTAPAPEPERARRCSCGREHDHICVEMNTRGRPKRAWYVSPQDGVEVDISRVVLDESQWIINTGTARLRVVIGFRPRPGSQGGSHAGEDN